MLFSKSFPQPAEGCNITCCNFLNLFLQFSYLETVDCNFKSNDAILKWQSCESCGVLYVHLGGHEPKIIIATMYYTVVHTYSMKGIKQELIAAGYGVSPFGWIETQFSGKDLFDCLINIIINFIPLKTCKLRCPFSRLFFCNLLMFAKNVNLH